MRIGLIKEIKQHEYRVGLTPENVRSYSEHGHTVFVEEGAGIGANFKDKDYQAAGGIIVNNKQKIFDDSEMIVKVKEPLESEYDFFHDGQILFTYLHLSANRGLTEALMRKKIKAVAYETITGPNHSLPCLMPMSEIAGRLSIQEGAKFLEKSSGGRGVLLGGVPGVQRGHVVIIGGGIVGLNACKMAVGLGAMVTILDISPHRLAYFDDIFNSKVTTLFSNRTNILQAIQTADLTIGAVLIPGASAPRLVSRQDLSIMKSHSVMVDVAIDQGGCFETSHVTYHDDPTFLVDDILHYCVANMPGVVSLTSTLALTSTTLNKGLSIANKGLESAMREDLDLYHGLNAYDGACTNKSVAGSLGIEYSEVTF